MEPPRLSRLLRTPACAAEAALDSPPASSGTPFFNAEADQKYICCNADEGDSGTYADRMIMEGDPFVLIEGMTIAALAVKATQGYIYCRSEYPHAFRTMQRAIATAYENGYLGANVAGSGKRFDLEVRLGAGAYICGEETSMLESLEGRRGQIRPSLRCPHSKACSASRRLSTISSRWPPSRLFWTKAQIIIATSAWADRAAR
jgi:hypothetical protein